MCGIVGYVGRRPAVELLLAGLERLEYRGYDSAGISVIEDGRVRSVRAVGNLSALRSKIDSTIITSPIPGEGGLDGRRQAARGEGARCEEPRREGARGEGAVVTAVKVSTIGIGHTRWATHGRVSEENAHPHFDNSDRVHVVVNGIVENHIALKRELVGEGAVFTSETDAEVIAHLISDHYRGDLTEAVREAYGRLEGHFAFVAMSVEEEERLVGARKECPLVIGRGEGEQFIASAVPGFLAETRQIQYVDNGEIVVLEPEGVRIMTRGGRSVERGVETIDWDLQAAEKGGYETFMLKEIHEQAEAVAETIADRTASGDGVDLDEEGVLDESLLQGVKRVVIVACGTSYHAGLIGRYALEEWARIPVEIDVASEYRYRSSVVGDGDLVVGISQSGETADTLAAVRRARGAGGRVLAITNVRGSQATRDADGVLFTRAGLEIGVAATKTFVSQVAAVYLLALRLAQLRGTVTPRRLSELVGDLKRLPHHIDYLLGPGPGLGGAGASSSMMGEQIARVAHEHYEDDFFLYIGRHVGLPVALEGALKLKEISYIATDAYAAGEMKHGPIALLDKSTTVIAVATESPVLEKIASNLAEVRARGASVVAITTEGDQRIAEVADLCIAVPRIDWMLQPILGVIPLQMLAYEIARRRGHNVDQPRNLAKTVTVE